MRLKIWTYVLCSFSALLLLLLAVGFVATDRIEQIGRLAGELNGHVIDKTKIAAGIVALGQQIRFLDAFLLEASSADEKERIGAIVRDRVREIGDQTASYRHYIDSPLEHSLLQNLQQSRSSYLAVQQEIMAMPFEERHRNIEAEEARLATAFDHANRQARGLSHVAEAQALAARDQAVDIARDARTSVLIVAGLAMTIGLLILTLLATSIFRPLAHLTKALIGLSEGRADVSLVQSGGSGEIAAIAQALDVFRTNAIALTKAHDETKAAHQRADLLARHDALTGLPNRRVLTSSIDAAIGRSERVGTACAVLMLDLDRFKPVNDLYGHSAGDRVLCEVATRLAATVRTEETAARLGGDEFAIVIEYQAGSDAPLRIAKRILAAICAPIAIEGRSVSVGTSIGIAVWPTDGKDAETLLHSADLAMFKAKRDKRGGFSFFEVEMEVQLRARADLESRIARAIDTGEIRPHYQPLVDLTTNEVTGFEVLSRWYDRDTVLQPSEFIQVAEEAGLIPQLTYAVLRQACRDARHWPGRMNLALNITPAQIIDIQMPAVLLGVLKDEDFPPSRLELEITENALIGDLSRAKTVIATLRAEGISISLDDFGTGYSSLHHLRELKFDKIKIDRCFIQSMLSSSESTTIVETVLALGRSLGILTIAEGIENEAHLSRLIDQGCQFGQGFHLGRPLPADGVTALLAGHGSADRRLTRAA